MTTDERTPDERLDRAQLARSAGVEAAFVEELTRLGIVATSGGAYRPTDVYRVRFAVLLRDAGIDLADAARAIEEDIVSFGDLETMFPNPALATSLTQRELADELGIDLDELMTIRLATGLATRRPDDPLRSDEDAILRQVVSAARGLGGIEHAATVGRMYGDRAERIASAAISLYREQVDRPWLETGERLDPEASRRGSQAGRRLLDETEQLLLALYRRAVDDGVLAGWLETTETLMSHHGLLAERTRNLPGVAFVDLSGFTNLTATRGDAFGTMLASRLLAETQRVVAASSARMVKLLGDGVMLQAAEPSRLVEATVELVEALESTDMPPAHAGVHAGPLVERDGDYFGHTVNVAARIAHEATAGEILISAAAAEQLPDTFDLEGLRPRALRGVPERLALFRVVR